MSDGDVAGSVDMKVKWYIDDVSTKGPLEGIRCEVGKLFHSCFPQLTVMIVPIHDVNMCELCV